MRKFLVVVAIMLLTPIIAMAWSEKDKYTLCTPAGGRLWVNGVEALQYFNHNGKPRVGYELYTYKKGYVECVKKYVPPDVVPVPQPTPPVVGTPIELPRTGACPC